MENLFLWFLLLTVIAACGIFGSWMLCNVRSYLGNPGGSRNQMRHPLFADDQQAPYPDVRHYHVRTAQPQPPTPTPATFYNGNLQRYPLPPYFIEPPIDYTPPATAQQPRRHGSTQSHTAAKKPTVAFERSSSFPF